MMLVKFNRAAIGLFSAALLVGTAGCGSDSKGGDSSTSEASRIAASIESRQSELSTESLDGLWFVYAENETKETEEYGEGKYTYKESGTQRTYASIEEDGDYAVMYTCSGEHINISLADNEVQGLDNSDLNITDNLKIKITMSQKESDEYYSYSQKLKLYFYKISDSAEFPIGEADLGDYSGDVACLVSIEDSWSEKETDGSETWETEGKESHFRIDGDNYIELSHYKGSDGEETWNEYKAEVDDEDLESADGNGISYSVDAKSPLLYKLSVDLGEDAPGLKGQVTIY